MLCAQVFCGCGGQVHKGLTVLWSDHPELI